MKGSRQYVITSIILASILVLFSDIQYVGAEAIWTVGSQISGVAASGDNVYVLWQNNSPDQNVYFRRSTDGGVTFDRVINLSNAVPPALGTSPKMAVSGNNVYVAWTDRVTLGSNSTVLFRRSTDGGATFEDAQVLSTNSKRESGIQQLFTLNNKVYALMIDEWAGNGTYYYDSTFRVSDNSGKTFSPPVSLLPSLSHSNIRGVTSVAASPSGDIVYAVGVDYGDCRPERRICNDDARIFFKQSTDGGHTFSEAKTIKRPSGIVTHTTSGRAASAPSWIQVGADNTHVGIVWGESPISSEQGSIFLALSSDMGETFTAPVALDAGAKGVSDWPLLLPTADIMYVAWNSRQDNYSLPHIGLIRINSDGSFTQPINVTGKSDVPGWDIAASGDSVFVAASNYTKNAGTGLPDGIDVYFYASADKGNSFEAPVALSNDNAIKTLLAAQQKSLSFISPMLAVSGERVYVVWGASYPDSHEIYIRASDDNGHTFGRMISLNEATNEPVSKVLALITSTPATYITIIASVGVAAIVSILVVKRQGNK
ncbi:MAG: sialidase family protein [Nitrososphaera sp.]|jgi:hypothetical protein